MGVKFPEEASPKKRKHSDEEKTSSLSEETSSVDTEALLNNSGSDLLLEKAHPCSETDAQIKELDENCDQSSESTCLPLKKRQRVQESGERNEMTESTDGNSGILGSTEKNETTINNGENQCGVDLSGEMALCTANKTQLDIDPSCKEDINGEILSRSDTANCSELQNGDSGDKAVEGEGEAILAEAPADSAGMEPMLKEEDFKESLKMHNQEDGTQEVEVSKGTALETEENKDTAEVHIAEQNKSHVGEVFEATCIGNGGVFPLPSTVSQENRIMEVDTNKKEAIPFASQDLSKDNSVEEDIASKEDTPQPLLGDSSHVSAPEDSKKKLLILDLNGLLADIIPYCNERYKHDFEVSHKYVYKRPHVDDFLQFCFERFAVAVWSSRTKKNIDPLLEHLIGPLQMKLLFCWDQSHCTQTRFTTVDNKEKPLVFKELSKVWEMHDDNLPWKKGQYTESNTLLLDDSPYKALLNPANTAIFPSSYRYTRIHDNSLGPGGDLRVYLEGLAVADNVQDYVKNNPFGQKAITESDPSWQYYQRVLRSYTHQDSTNESLPIDAVKSSHRDDAGKWSHLNDAGKWSHRYDDSKWSQRDHTGRWSQAGRWSHRYDDRRWSHRDDGRGWSHRDDGRGWSHRDDGRRWSHRDDGRRWSHRDDGRRWSYRDDGRRWSRDNARESRHEDARKLPRDDARESQCDYVGKSTKDDTTESETLAVAVGESTPTAN